MATTVTGQDVYDVLNQSTNDPALSADKIDGWLPRLEKDALGIEPRLVGDDLDAVVFQLALAASNEFLGNSGDSWKIMARTIAKGYGKNYDNAKQKQGCVITRGVGDADIVVTADMPNLKSDHHDEWSGFGCR
jgi:hypothetical protein